MVRKVSVFLLLAAVLLFGGYAEAARRTFGDAFSVDVPSGWQVEEEGDESTAQITFTAPDNSRASIFVGVNDEGATARDVAVEIAEAVGGSTPVADEDGDYTFTFRSDDGLDGAGFVAVNEEVAVIFLVIGDNPQMEAFLGSFELVE